MRARLDCGVCGTPRAIGAACRPCATARKKAYKKSAKGRAASSRYKKALHARGAVERAIKKAAKRASVAARRLAARRKWKLANPGIVNAHTAARFAAKMRAVPAWADRDEIQRIYVAARASGMHVDHIVPLRSPIVCGLHVQDNLQLLPPVENIRKGNRLMV